MRQIAGVVILHVLDLLQDNARPASGRFAAYPDRAQCFQLVQHQLPDLLANRLAANKAAALAQGIDQRPGKKKPGQQEKLRHQLFARDLRHDQRLQQGRQAPGLSDHQQAAEDAQKNGDAQAASRRCSVFFQPADEFGLPGFIHAGT